MSRGFRLPALHGIQQQSPQIEKLNLRLKIGYRSPGIGSDQIQHGLYGPREAANAQVPSQP